MVSRSISYYRILNKLGEGGMGEVWLAEDTRLERKVALKLLPAEFTQDADRVRRFMQEARAASALNHPNIITVYDIGECEAGRFIVMELVAGRTLRAVIAEDNSLETLLTLGQQTARALSAAHAAGITHRDIKPDNVMVRDDGYVKVLDFGLARLLPTASGEDAATLAQQTMPGQLLGTVAYMSPEQACGQSVSPPSDIFALGIVLYELATGRHPFQADTLVGYLHAISLQTPPSVTDLKPEFPAALGDLILRMLEKEAGKRPTASQVAQALQEIERYGTGHARPIKTTSSGSVRADEGFWVAVLPFKWRGANADLEALAEGLSEDIVTSLSRFSYLRVIARSSTLRFTSEAADVRTVGKQLGARYVMEGNLRQAGSMLRVAVQLVDASTGAHLWAETYNRTFSPEAVFELQDDLVPRIVSTVADWYGALPHSMSEAVRLKPPDQLSPYEAVLRSFGYFERIAPEEHAAVRAGLERAVEQAPGNADGWAMLSMMYGEEHRFSFNVQPDALGRSLEAARRAVDAAHANHFAWLALAQALFFRKEFDAFRDAAERAIALNPMDGSTLEYLGHLIAFSGDWERGCDVAERARQLNPNHPGWYWAVHFLDSYRTGDYHGARTYLHKCLMRGGTAQAFTQALLAALYGQLGEREAAEQTLRNVLNLKPDFALTGREEFGKWYLPELVEHLMEGLRKAGLEIGDEERQELERKESGESERHSGSESATRNPSAAIRHTVGREPERNELRAAFTTAKAGRGSLMCVAGEPGIGKTTLVEYFLAELTTENQCTIARGRCSERLAGTEAYLPLLEALESLLQNNRGLAQTMKQLAPTWYAQVAPLAGESEESASRLAEVKAASQERIKRELVNFLQKVARLRPLILFFDDLHWADVSTIDVLSFLAGKLDALKLLIVVTYRPSDMMLSKHPFLQIKPDLQARGVCRELLLEFLTESEIAEYLALEFPGHHFPTEFPKLIHTKTEGSPLFMADLVRYLRDRGVIAQSSGAWMLGQALPDIEQELPESVRGMIERKIAQLGEEDRRLLVAASVQGYEFDSAVVGQVLNLEADEVEERLEKLERVFSFVKLVSESEFPNHTLTLKYRFVHVLYQHTLYAGLRLTRKTSLSAAVAQSLEGFHGKQSTNLANELALLWEEAREYARAADYFLKAAGNATQINAHREAIQLARRGLETLQRLPELPECAPVELGLQLRLGLSLTTVHGWTSPEAEQCFTRAHKLCQQAGNDPRLFAALRGIWARYLMRGEYETARPLADQLLQLAEQADDPVMLASACFGQGITIYPQGELSAAREYYERALALYDPVHYKAYLAFSTQDLGVQARGILAFCLWNLGFPDRALKLDEEALSLAESLSHPFSLAGALYWLSTVCFLRGEWQASQRYAERALALSEENDLGDYLIWTTLYHDLAQGFRGQPEAKIDQVRQTLDGARAKGLEFAMPVWLAYLAELSGMAGQTVAGLDTTAEALARIERTGERYWEAEVWRIKGDLLLQSDNPSQSEAEDCYHKAIKIAQGQSAKSLELRAAMRLARLWQQQGKASEAGEMLAEIYGWFTEGFDTADLKDAKAVLDELQQQDACQ